MSQNPVVSSVAESLVPFTGYYTLDAGPGAFLLVDTNYLYALVDGTPVITYKATITFSLNGTSSAVFDADTCCTFDNGNLTVAYDGITAAQVYLFKDTANGNVSSLTGTVEGTAVTGSTPFNPIEMQVFAAEYFEPVDGGYQGRLTLNPDYSVWFREGSGDFVQVTEYFYNYAMFVIGFTLNGETNTFEMGTTSASGRVAGNSAKAGLFVSITSSNVYPPVGQTVAKAAAAEPVAA